MDMVNSVNELTIIVNKLERLTRLISDIEMGKMETAYFQVDGMGRWDSECSYDSEAINFEKDLFVEYLNAEIKLNEIRVSKAIEAIKVMWHNEDRSTMC